MFEVIPDIRLLATSKERTVFLCLNNGITSSNSVQGIHICFVSLCCLTRGCIQKFLDRVDNEITITINTQDATQRVMEAKLTRLTHQIAIQ